MKNRLVSPPYIASTEEYGEYLEVKGTEKIYDNVDLTAQDNMAHAIMPLLSYVYFSSKQEEK